MIRGQRLAAGTQVKMKPLRGEYETNNNTPADPQPPPAANGHDSDQQQQKGSTVTMAAQGSCNLDEGRTSNQENLHNDGEAAGTGGGQRGNKLSRQMSSQSSKRSQRPDELHNSGEGQNQDIEHLKECAERALRPAGSANQQASEPKQTVESSVPSDRRCRLCWCCCCPCSA